jgi:hypothetical protein
MDVSISWTMREGCGDVFDFQNLHRWRQNFLPEAKKKVQLDGFG